MVRLNFKSLLQAETVMRWQFLDSWLAMCASLDGCAVVSSRMELMYMNERCQSLVPHEWFAKRCFQVLPNTDPLCALDCPTIAAVQTSETVVYAEECLTLADRAALNLGTAIIPLRSSIGEGAKAILLFRSRETESDELNFRTRLLGDARALCQFVHDTLH